MTTFQYSQDVQNTDSYKWLLWQQYLTDINFKYTFQKRIEITTHKFQIHNTVIDILKNKVGQK